MSEDNNQSNTPNISQISRKTLDYVDSGFGQHFLTKTNKNQYEFRKENTDTFIKLIILGLGLLCFYVAIVENDNPLIYTLFGLTCIAIVIKLHFFGAPQVYVDMRRKKIWTQPKVNHATKKNKKNYYFKKINLIQMISEYKVDSDNDELQFHQINLVLKDFNRINLVNYHGCDIQAKKDAALLARLLEKPLVNH